MEAGGQADGPATAGSGSRSWTSPVTGTAAAGTDAGTASAPHAHGIPVAPGQPVVGLDFDGVLNITARGDLPDGYALHVVELDRDNWPDHPYIRPLPDGPGPFLHGVVVSREHGQMVRAWLAAGACVVWATTWERAVLRNAHLCDIPELPVLEISKVLAGQYPRRTADWKVAGLQAAFPGHPLVWVDDFGADRRGESTYGQPPSPILVIAPDESIGLTREQSAEVLGFIERWRPDDGGMSVSAPPTRAGDPADPSG